MVGSMAAMASADGSKNAQLVFIPPDLLQRQSLRAAQGLEQICIALDKVPH